MCADCAATAALQNFGGGVRGEMAEEKREKCPGCGRMCIGKQAMWKTIDSAGFQIFEFNCTACGAVWMKAAARRHRKKILRKCLRVPFVPIV